MRAVVLINGPINAGKSTVGARLARLLPKALFVEGDDHDAPDDASLPQRIEAAWCRILSLIAEMEQDYLVVAYPIEDERREELAAVTERRKAALFVVTLAPPVEIALSNRGARILSVKEKLRAEEMYREGYAKRAFSDLVIDNSRISAEETAAIVAEFVINALT